MVLLHVGRAGAASEQKKYIVQLLIHSPVINYAFQDFKVSVLL